MPDENHVAEFWTNTVLQAYRFNATDIHIEPRIHSTLIRFRVDGQLQHYAETPSQLHDHLISYIKIKANLDIAEKRLPQDGSYRIDITTDSKNSIDCRLSSIPTIYGEKVVARLLPDSMHELNLANLNLDTKQRESIYWALESNQGLILVTGPTGSGKTRTLFSCLNHLNDGTRNISTVENPVEIQLHGLNQTSINEQAGLSFDIALRALLRQDPDVLLIGEIRDSATAHIAITAAQTGHLVLASLHTNSALDAIHRLSSLGCNHRLLAQSLLLVSSQRLIRLRCKACKGNSSKIRCETCAAGTGRIDVHEMIPFTTEMRQVLFRTIEPDALRNTARSQGIQFLSETISNLVNNDVLDVQHAGTFLRFFE